MQPIPEIPEDVKAELDLEARRIGVTPTRPAPVRIPEDVRSELDREHRAAEARTVGTLSPDGPPLSEVEAESELDETR